MVYLEHTTGKSNKFWEGRLDGTEMVTRWGKIGTNGQEKAKSFDSVALAQQALDKVVTQKQKKGYVEVAQEADHASTPSATTPQPPVPARDSAPDVEQSADPPAPVAAVNTVHVVSSSDEDVVWTPEALEFVGGLPDCTPFDLPQLNLNTDKIWEEIQAHVQVESSDHSVEVTGDTHACQGFEVACQWHKGQAKKEEINRDVLHSALLFWTEDQLERVLRYSAGSLGAFEAVRLFVESLRYSVLTSSNNNSTSYQVDVILSLVPPNSYGYQLRKQTEGKMRACLTLRRLMNGLSETERKEIHQVASDMYTSLRAEHRQIIRALYPDDEALAELEPQATHHFGRYEDNKLVYYDLLATRSEQGLYDILSRLPSGHATPAGLTLPTLLYEQGPDVWANVVSHAQLVSVARTWVPMVRTSSSIKYWSAWLEQDKAETLGQVMDVLHTYPVRALLGCVHKQSLQSRMLARHLCQDVPDALDSAMAQAQGHAIKALEAFVPLPKDQLTRPEDLPDLLTAPPWRKKKKAVKALKVKGLEPPELPISVDVPKELLSHTQALSEKGEESLRTCIQQDADKPGMLDSYYVYVRAPRTRSLLNAQDINTIRDIWGLIDEAYWCLDIDDYSARLLSALDRHKEGLLEFLMPLAARYVSASVPAMRWVKSVGAARVMAEALHRLKSRRQEARQWFDAHTTYACTALLADAVGTDRKRRQHAESAFAYIASLDVPHGPIFEAFAAHYSDEVAAYGQLLFERDPLEMHPKLKKLPGWMDTLVLSRPVLASDPSRQLDDDAMQALVEMCSFYDPEGVYAGFTYVQEYFTAPSLSKFAISLCELWLDFDGSSKLSWCLLVVGQWGDDAAVRALTPGIRRWPGESASKRAQLGLETLARIGTDLALTNVYSMSQKMKFASLKTRAAELVDEIAEGRGLTVLELGDRLIPDFDLDVRGRMELDYGPRTFLITLNEHLQPRIKDVQRDKVIKSLPKPGVSDDEALAKEAKAWFKGFKKDLKTVAAQQLQRLENALIQQRRWAAEDFENFLVDHPLMITLTSRLLWGTFDADDHLVKSFRVDVDHSIVDSADEPVVLQGLQIGLVHPAQLSPAQNDAWQGVMSDFEIIQPFEQLGRTFHCVDDATALLAKHVVGAKIPAPKLVYGLDKSGWERGFPYGGSSFHFHSRELQDGYSVHVHYDGAVAIHFVEENEILTITHLFISKSDEHGHIQSTLKGSPQHCSPIIWSEIASELLRIVGQ